MGLTTLNPAKYGRLLSKARPKVIETGDELDQSVAQLEQLDFAKRQLTPEEEALRQLLARLIEDDDDRRHPLPELPPNAMLRFLMEQRGLRQADLVPAIGARSQVSDIVNGKRSISKAQAKTLAEFFHVSAEFFL